MLVVLDGEAACVIPDTREHVNPRTEVLRPGEFVYYPAYQYHTIRNPSQQPVLYIMMKWRGPLAFDLSQWSVPVIRPEKVIPKAGESFAPRFLLEFPTSYLAKLHAHQSVLMPSAGYDPHFDNHDVAIIVLSGILESQGRTFGPHGFLLHSAGAAHGLRNIGIEPARYLVFEFHAPKLPTRIERTRGINLLEQLTAARAEGDRLASQKTALEAALAAVWASSSWRITAPLRRFSGLLRRNR